MLSFQDSDTVQRGLRAADQSQSCSSTTTAETLGLASLAAAHTLASEQQENVGRVGGVIEGGGSGGEPQGRLDGRSLGPTGGKSKSGRKPSFWWLPDQDGKQDSFWKRGSLVRSLTAVFDGGKKEEALSRRLYSTDRGNAIDKLPRLA